MKKIYISIISIMISVSLHGQVSKQTKESLNAWKFGVSAQLSPLRSSHMTFGGSFDFYKLNKDENLRPKLYVSLFIEGGTNNKNEVSGLVIQLKRSDFHIGTRIGFAISNNLIAYGLLESHSWRGENMGILFSIRDEFEFSSFGYGAGIKRFMGKKKSSTVGLEFSSQRGTTLHYGIII